MCYTDLCYKCDLYITASIKMSSTQTHLHSLFSASYFFGFMLYMQFITSFNLESIFFPKKYYRHGRTHQILHNDIVFSHVPKFLKKKRSLLMKFNTDEIRFCVALTTTCTCRVFFWGSSGLFV